MPSPRFDLVLLRSAPLTAGELSSSLHLVEQWRQRRWAHVTDFKLIALEGLGTHRVWAGFRYTEPDRELDELPRIALMLESLLLSVPGARIRVRDDLAIFSHDHRRFTLKGTAGLPELDPGWYPPEEAWLQVDLPAAVEASAGPPQTESELLDLLEIIERAGEDSALIRAGAGGAVRYGPQLQALTARRQFSAGACTLLASLAQRELALLHDNAGTAQQIVLDGDAREREAARRLLSALSMTSAADEAKEEPGATSVATIGMAILESVGWEEDEDPETEEIWEDDLFTEDLELLSAPDADLPESPLAEALRAGVDPETLRGMVHHGGREGLATSILLMLSGSDAEATGAAALLAQGVWPGRRVPGLTDALHSLASAPSRPTATRQVAVRALAATRRPDAGPLLIQLSASESLDIAREALLALGHVVGASARRRVREALADARLAAWALASMAKAGDVAGFDAAAGLIRAREASLQRAAARYLDQLGGRRALPLVEALYQSSQDWEVKLEAAAALARLAPVEKLSAVLNVQDPEVLTWGLWSLGRSGRADAADWIRSAASSPRAEIREAAVVALGEQRLPAETPILLECLSDADPGVAAAAAEALGRCGDRRAVAVLRELARQPGPLGEQARRALRDGHQLRLPPPDTWLVVRAVSPAPLSQTACEHISAALGQADLQLSLQPQRFEARKQIAPGDTAALRSLVAALESLVVSVPGLRWSVRDPQAIIRRLGNHFILSAQTGAVARDAGWFPQTPPLPDTDRPQLAAAPPPPQEFHSLPITVTSRDIDDDLSLHSVQAAAPLPAWEAPEEATESMELTIGRWLEDAEPEEEPARAEVRSVRDALSLGQTEAVLHELAGRALRDTERSDLKGWLAGGDHQSRILACRIIEVTGEADLLPDVLPSLAASDALERRQAARAVGAIGDSDCLKPLAALLTDSDVDVVAAAREAISAISGPSLGDDQPVAPAGPGAW
ncbi:MAG: HEAT repeat domain-containing protein [Myxococcota bacterium]|nr:HEAT repeat domain-containing protein [Myxococcota bacterium]